MTHNDRLVINTLSNPVSTDAQCMHYGDMATLHKYSALVWPRLDHNGEVYNSAIIHGTLMFTAKIHEYVCGNYVAFVKKVSMRRFISHFITG